MRNRAQLRWIAEAEAAHVRESALIQRGISEPLASIVVEAPMPARLDRFAALLPSAGAVIRWLFFGKRIAASPQPAAPKVIALANARQRKERGRVGGANRSATSP